MAGNAEKLMYDQLWIAKSDEDQESWPARARSFETVYEVCYAVPPSVVCNFLVNVVSPLISNLFLYIKANHHVYIYLRTFGSSYEETSSQLKGLVNEYSIAIAFDRGNIWSVHEFL